VSQPKEMPGLRAVLGAIGAFVGFFVAAEMGGSNACNRIIFFSIGGFAVGLLVAAAIEMASGRSS